MVWKKMLVCAAVGVMAGLVGQARAAFQLGDWENGSSDQWIDWSTQNGYSGGPTDLPSPKFTFDSTTGVTSGASSLKLTQNGWNQNLAVKLEYITGAKAAFFANNALAIDVTTPATTASGWSQIYQFAINAPGWGFKSLTANPVPGAQWGWGANGGGAVTHHLVFDYSSALAQIPANAGYVEFIFATNNDGADTHGTYYFDNAQLITVPEPGMMGLAGIAALAVVGRRKR